MVRSSGCSTCLRVKTPPLVPSNKFTQMSARAAHIFSACSSSISLFAASCGPPPERPANAVRILVSLSLRRRSTAFPNSILAIVWRSLFIKQRIHHFKVRKSIRAGGGGWRTFLRVYIYDSPDLRLIIPVHGIIAKTARIVL
jgi:hypothetical protein